VTNIISTTWTFQFRQSAVLLGFPSTEIEQLTPYFPLLFASSRSEEAEF
jgi:hypothetical protein